MFIERILYYIFLRNFMELVVPLTEKRVTTQGPTIASFDVKLTFIIYRVSSQRIERKELI